MTTPRPPEETKNTGMSPRDYPMGTIIVQNGSGDFVPVSRPGIDVRASIEAADKQAIERVVNTQQKPIDPPRQLSDLAPGDQRKVLTEFSSLLAAVEATDVEAPSVPEFQPSDAAASPSETMVHFCRNCGWRQGEDPIEITDEDKANWLRSVLGDVPFIKAYSLFGGKIIATFRARTVEESGIIQDQIQLDMNNGKFPKGSQEYYLLAVNNRLRRLNCAVSFINVTGGNKFFPLLTSAEGQKLFLSSPTETSAESALQVKFKGWSSPLFDALYKTSCMFDILCLRLAEASNSENFWVGIEH